MKIALIGYGRMGHEIEKIAIERGHSISYKITSESMDTAADVTGVDVAIEFTRPDTALSNNKVLVENKVPVVSGTTGWNHQLKEFKSFVEKQNGSFLHSSNFSIGVNIFFEINKKLAAIMNQFEDYDVSMEEIHHTRKLDAPSGTAVTIAEQIIDKITRKNQWVLAGKKEHEEENLSIKSLREGDVPGTHKVKYSSAIDEIEIIHKAYNRTGFALGAVLAAEWIKDKKGFFTMSDFLKI